MILVFKCAGLPVVPEVSCGRQCMRYPVYATG
jgi:hypothetical protein